MVIITALNGNTTDLIVTHSTVIVCCAMCTYKQTPGLPPEIVVWIYNTFDDNFEIENDLIKYLMESYR